MTGLNVPLYAPALRMKAGELDGMAMLDSKVADVVLPRLIIPPKGERGGDSLLPLQLERIPDFSAVLATVWRHRPVLIDLGYILDEFERDKTTNWVPLIFKIARQRGILAIPAVTLTDLAQCLKAFEQSIDRFAPLKLALIISSDELSDKYTQTYLNQLLEKLDLSPQECTVIAEFTGVEFSDHVIVAPIIRYTLETLQEWGIWKHIIFQGSHYPEKNPAEHSSFVIWPRNEWLAWKLAVRFDPSTAEQMIFGDFCADCSKIQFGGNGGKAIRHVRYTVGDNWRIERGPKVGSDRSAMHQVYSELVDSDDFLGSHFSNADAYIAQASANPSAPHGSARTWRSLNTAHHITHVVNDIAGVRNTRTLVRAISDEFLHDSASER